MVAAWSAILCRRLSSSRDGQACQPRRRDLGARRAKLEEERALTALLIAAVEGPALRSAQNCAACSAMQTAEDFFGISPTPSRSDPAGSATSSPLYARVHRFRQRSGSRRNPASPSPLTTPALARASQNVGGSLVPQSQPPPPDGAQLTEAAEKCDLARVRKLLAAGANVQAKDAYSCTALHHACMHAHYACMHTMHAFTYTVFWCPAPLIARPASPPRLWPLACIAPAACMHACMRARARMHA